MFCANCGNQLDPSYRFCAQCGKDSQPQPDPSVCTTCGAQIAPGAKFCNNCGTACTATQNAKPAVSFCKYCSKAYEPNEKFCKQCGQPKDGARAPFIGQTSGGGLLHSANDLHQMILGGLFFILLLLWFIPSMALGSGGIDLTTSLALPFADTTFSSALDFDTAPMVLLTILIFIIDVIPLLGCVGLSVLSILKGQLNPKILLIQMIVAAKSVIAIFVYWIIHVVIIDSSFVTIFPTFGGWMIFLVASFTTLVALWLFLQTKRLRAQH